MKSVNLVIRLRPEHKAQVEAAALQAGVSAAEWVRRLLFRRLGGTVAPAAVTRET